MLFLLLISIVCRDIFKFIHWFIIIFFYFHRVFLKYFIFGFAFYTKFAIYNWWGFLIWGSKIIFWFINKYTIIQTIIRSIINLNLLFIFWIWLLLFLNLLLYFPFFKTFRFFQTIKPDYYSLWVNILKQFFKYIINSFLLFSFG